MSTKQIFIMCALFLLLMTLPQASAWWNNSWGTRAINEISDGTRDAQLSINISNGTGTNNATWLFCGGLCNADFSDVRFILEDVTALPIAAENITTVGGVAVARFWVNLTGNGNVYWYYNNTNANPVSDFNSTFQYNMNWSNQTSLPSKWTKSVLSTTVSFSTADGLSVITGGSGGWTRGIYENTMHLTAPFVVRSIGVTTNTSYGFGMSFTTNPSNTNVINGDGGNFELRPGDSPPGFGAETVSGGAATTPKYFNGTSAKDYYYNAISVVYNGTGQQIIANDTVQLYSTITDQANMHLSYNAFTASSSFKVKKTVVMKYTDAVWAIWSPASSPGAPEYMPPTPINVSSNFTCYYVNLTFEPGAGNATDEFDVYYAYYWHNTSSRFYNFTDINPLWNNFSVYAKNISITGKFNTTPVIYNVLISSSCWNALSDFSYSENSTHTNITWNYTGNSTKPYYVTSGNYYLGSTYNNYFLIPISDGNHTISIYAHGNSTSLQGNINHAAKLQWADTSYPYRINLGNIGFGTARFNLSNSTGTSNSTHIFLNGNATSDFRDIRLYSNQIKIPYYINSGMLYINNSIGGTVYLYYGKNTSITQSNPRSTFNIYEDFEQSISNFTDNELRHWGITVDFGGPFAVYHNNTTYISVRKVNGSNTDLGIRKYWHENKTFSPIKYIGKAYQSNAQEEMPTINILSDGRINIIATSFQGAQGARHWRSVENESIDSWTAEDRIFLNASEANFVLSTQDDEIYYFAQKSYGTPYTNGFGFVNSTDDGVTWSNSTLLINEGNYSKRVVLWPEDYAYEKSEAGRSEKIHFTFDIYNWSRDNHTGWGYVYYNLTDHTLWNLTKSLGVNVTGNGSLLYYNAYPRQIKHIQVDEVNGTVFVVWNEGNISQATWRSTYSLPNGTWSSFQNITTAYSVTHSTGTAGAYLQSGSIIARAEDDVDAFLDIGTDIEWWKWDGTSWILQRNLFRGSDAEIGIPHVVFNHTDNSDVMLTVSQVTNAYSTAMGKHAYVWGYSGFFGDMAPYLNVDDSLSMSSNAIMVNSSNHSGRFSINFTAYDPSSIYDSSGYNGKTAVWYFYDSGENDTDSIGGLDNPLIQFGVRGNVSNSTYVYGVDGVWYNTSINRSTGWHEARISTNSTKTALYIDNAGIYIYPRHVWDKADILRIGKTQGNYSGQNFVDDVYVYDMVSTGAVMGSQEEVDPTPPSSITDLSDLVNATSVSWTWVDPVDVDFDHVMIYLNGIFKTNVSKGVKYYKAVGLTTNTTYEISTKTVDNAGNINSTWVNRTSITNIIITVNASGGADYLRIQDAIYNASNGDKISVASGNYIENLVVNKSVNLVGEESEATIVQAADTNNHVFNVTANSVNITGFRIKGATGSQKAGIYFSSSGNNNISENNISNNYYGIYLFSSGNNIYYGNLFNNTINVDFGGSIFDNIWNITKKPDMNIAGGSYLGGNFWADSSGTGFSQTCADPDKDGICDTNYTLNSGNIDYLPLAAIPSGYGFISGYVLNNSSGISNSFVTTNTSNSTTTDVSGFYSILVPVGTYNLTVTKEPEYYSNTSIVVIAISGTTVAQNIELIKKPIGNITGIVSIVW